MFKMTPGLSLRDKGKKKQALIITVKSKTQGPGAGSIAHYRAKLSEP